MVLCQPASCQIVILGHHRDTRRQENSKGPSSFLFLSGLLLQWPFTMREPFHPSPNYSLYPPTRHPQQSQHQSLGVLFSEHCVPRLLGLLCFLVRAVPCFPYGWQLLLAISISVLPHVCFILCQSSPTPASPLVKSVCRTIEWGLGFPDWVLSDTGVCPKSI